VEKLKKDKEDALRKETEHIFETPLNQAIHDSAISSPPQQPHQEHEEGALAAFMPTDTGMDISDEDDATGAQQADISISDLNTIKRKLNIILRIIERSTTAAASSDVKKMSESLTGLITKISNLHQGLSSMNTKLDSFQTSIQSMIQKAVSSEISKLLLDDKFAALSKAFESLLVEVKKEMESVKNAFSSQSADWKMIQAQLVLREKKEAELLATVQSLRDQTNTLNRATTRTSEIEHSQNKIFAALAELKSSIALFHPLISSLASTREQQTSNLLPLARKGEISQQSSNLLWFPILSLHSKFLFRFSHRPVDQKLWKVASSPRNQLLTLLIREKPRRK